MSATQDALELATRGYYVFPVQPSKAPYPGTRGLLEASQDPEQIATWFDADYPSALIGVVPGLSGLTVIDLDRHGDKPSGFASAASAQLPSVAEYSGTSISGNGTHLWYRGAAPSSNGIFPGIDRKSLGGYVVVSSYVDDLPYVEEITEPAPNEYLSSGGSAERDARPFGSSVVAWEDAAWLSSADYEDGESLSLRPARLIAAMSGAGVVFTGHELMLRTQKALVMMVGEGEAGVTAALMMLRYKWLVSPHGEGDEPGLEWDRAYVQAIATWGGERTPEQVEVQVDAEREARIATRIAMLDEDDEVKRRRAGRDYTGTSELTWDDLEAREVDWYVQDLVQVGGMVFLLAPSNTGKTFALVDMVCRMNTGMPWLGKPTKPARTVLVLGEGSYGLIDRFKAWCEVHDVDLDTLKPFIRFIDGANLNSDQSISILREKAADAELIVFDTYATTSGLQDENDSALASRVMNTAADLNRNATVIFTHHPRKAEAASANLVMRGSGAVDGRADAVLALYKDKGFSAQGQPAREWMAISTEKDHGGKLRNGRNETIRGLYLESVDDSAVMQQTESEALSKGDRFIRDHLFGSMTIKEFSAAANLHLNTARRYLVESSRVARVAGAGAQGDRYYQIGQGGQPVAATPMGFRRNDPTLYAVPAEAE